MHCVERAFFKLLPTQTLSWQKFLNMVVIRPPKMKNLHIYLCEHFQIQPQCDSSPLGKERLKRPSSQQRILQERFTPLKRTI